MLLIVNSTVHAATDRVTLDIYIFLGAFWPRKREMIRNRRARNTTSNKQPEVLPGCFLESWVIDYPLTEKPEGSLKMFHSQDPQRSSAVVPQYESCSKKYRVCMEQRYTVADQDLAISERPVKKVFSVPLASVWSKNKGGAGSPRPLP